MAETQLRKVVAGVVIALSLCGQAFALTVYDVIQLSDKKYSDDDIIALIQATDSAFELKAGDITRLMELGVSERVIQVMLKAVPGETGESPAETAPVAPSGAASSATPGSAATLAGGRFAHEPFSESGVGRHHHSVVTLAGVRLLVIRDEGLFSSVAARADAIVKRLGQAASAGSGAFRPGQSPAGDSVMFYGENTQSPMLLLKVSPADAIAYQRRSGRAVTPALLAAYWSDLLSDYWSIAVSRATPARLSGLHEGEALTALLEQWQKVGEAGEKRLDDAARLLPRQTQQHLLDLATTVPHDFMVTDAQRIEQP